MGDAVLIALIVALIFLFMLVFFGLRHRQEAGERISNIKRLRFGPEGINIEFYEKAVLAKEGYQLPRTSGEATLRRIRGGRVLWVDDEPANNELEIEALRGREVDVDCATSNDEALEHISADPAAYDLILSDIARGSEGPRAGLELPAKLHASGVEAPIAFYVGSVDRPATDAGDPVFAAPTALFEYIGDQLGGRSREGAVRG